MNEFFEKNRESLVKCNMMLDRIFLFSGAEEVSEFNRNRCLEEVGNFVKSVMNSTFPKVVKHEYAGDVIDSDRNEFIRKYTPSLDIKGKKPYNFLTPMKSIDEMFVDYKATHNMTDEDFRINMRRSRERRYVDNKAMFSQTAYRMGYHYKDIARILGLDRATIINHIHHYKQHASTHEQTGSRHTAEEN